MVRISHGTHVIWYHSFPLGTHVLRYHSFDTFLCLSSCQRCPYLNGQCQQPGWIQFRHSVIINISLTGLNIDTITTYLNQSLIKFTPKIKLMNILRIKVVNCWLQADDRWIIQPSIKNSAVNWWSKYTTMEIGILVYLKSSLSILTKISPRWMLYSNHRTNNFDSYKIKCKMTFSK